MWRLGIFFCCFLSTLIAAFFFGFTNQLTYIAILFLCPLAVISRNSSGPLVFALVGICFGLLLSIAMRQQMQSIDRNTAHSQQMERRFIGKVKEVGKYSFLLQATQVADKGRLSPMEQIVRVGFREDSNVNAKLSSGQSIAALVRLKPAKRQRVPGGYDEKLQMAFKNIDANATLVAFEVLASPLEATFMVRSLSRIEQLEYRQGKAVLAAMLLGHKNNLDESIKNTFRRSGVYHLLVVSGLHLGLIGSFLFVLFTLITSIWPPLLRRINRRKVAVLLSAVWCGIYVWMIGSQVPVVRAFYVLTVAASALWINRPVRPIYILTLVATAMLIWQPLWILSASYQLTFTVTAGILLVAEFLQRPNRIDGRHWTFRWLVSAAAICLAAFAFSLPIVAYHFNDVSLIGPLTNLVIAPVLGWLVLPIGFLGLLVSEIHLAIGSHFLEIAAWIVECSIALLEQLSNFPFASVAVASPNFWLIALYFSGLFLLVSIFRQKKIGAALLVGSAFFIFRAPIPAQTMEGIIVDVGDGLAVLLQARDKAGTTRRVLIDTGSKWQCKSRLLKTLKYNGIRHLDAIFISHWDEDHYGCLEQILESIQVERLYASYAPRRQIDKITIAAPGQQFEFGPLELAVINEPIGANETDNNRSLVLLAKWVEAGGKTRRAVFPGDIERKVESKLVMHWPINQRADLMVAPHHGSHTSNTAAWIEAFRPMHVLFSRERSPDKKVLQRYREAQSHLWLTRQLGSIYFASGEKGLSLRGHSCHEHGKPLTGWGLCP
jgi:competence protein ComEC